jgi:hypothetical protein
LVKYLVSLIKFSFPKCGVGLSRLLSEWRLVFKMFNFTVEEYATSVLSAILVLVLFDKRYLVLVEDILRETSLVEDVPELGMRMKQMDTAANITAQVLTSRLENYEMTERHLARVKMKMLDIMPKVLAVVEMY